MILSVRTEENGKSHESVLMMLAGKLAQLAQPARAFYSAMLAACSCRVVPLFKMRWVATPSQAAPVVFLFLSSAMLVQCESFSRPLHCATAIDRAVYRAGPYGISC